MINLCRTQQTTDIIHGTIQYSGIESAVISTPIFNRLHRILQSSMVYLTFSSNKVKRFEHSLGTMYLAGEILYQGFVNTEDKTTIEAFLADIREEILAWYHNANFMSNPLLKNEISDQYPQEGTEILSISYPDSALYREYTPSNIAGENKFIYLTAFEAVRLAALLHDIGHLPYSHILEDAIRELYLKVSAISEKEQSGGQKEFIKIIDPYYKDSDNIHAIHEEIGKALVSQIKATIEEEALRASGPDGVFIEIVFDFAQKILKAEPTANTIFSDLHWIISGVVDADRLDYCTRDLFCAGTNKNIFPYQRLIRTYRIIQTHLDMDAPLLKDGSVDKIREHFLFCPASKCVVEIEELLERRMSIFSQINYNHRVHKHEVLFSNVLSTIGFDELSKLPKLSPINSGEALPLEVSSIWALINKLQAQKSLIDYLVIQLDDSWMDTLLKASFFKAYGKDYRNMRKYGPSKEWPQRNRFDELISGHKRYRSCFKGIVDFQEFDILFCSKWDNPNPSGSGSATRDVDLNSIVPAKAKVIQKAKEEIKKYKNTNSPHLMVFNYLLDAFAGNKTTEFFHHLEMRLNVALQSEVGRSCHISDCIVRSCQFGLGLNTNVNPVFLWKKDSAQPISLDAISNQRAVFRQTRDFLPSFHLYYLPTYDTNNRQFDQPDLQCLKDMVAEFSADLIWEYVKSS